MSTRIEIEKVFASELDATDFFNEAKRENPMYNLIRFTFLSGEGKLYFYLVTTITLRLVICASTDYLNMILRYSRKECGFEPSDKGYFLAGVELIDM